MTVREILLDNWLAGRRNALAVQGGGMRGVYSMGALAALEEASLRNAFAVCIGSSAGAINAGYFLAGQAHDAVQVYTDYLSNSNFINPFRIWKIVDIDYMVDEVLKVHCPLDLAELRKSPSELKIVLTDAWTAQPSVVNTRDDQLDIYEAIRATAAMPTLYNRRIQVGDRLYIDGALSDSMPIRLALAEGCAGVLGVLTRARGHRSINSNPIVRAVGRMAAVGQSAHVRARIGIADEVFNSAMDVLENHESIEGARIWGVYPTDTSRLADRTTANKAALIRCAELGREDMHRLLDSTAGDI